MSDDAKNYFWAQGLISFVQGGDAARGRARHGSGASLRGRNGLRQHGELMPEKKEDAQGCMKEFNPQSEAETQAVVANWASAYMDLAAQVASRGKKSVAPTANATLDTYKNFIQGALSYQQ